ncbi:MAG: FAD-linked oxidase C-terminal domain-containing protein, partial [Janthinobacterium lividum]
MMFSILNNRLLSTAHESAAKPALLGPHLEQTLRATVRGDVQFDDAARALYATDASNYRQVPIGVVLPRDVEDVLAVMKACREAGAPVLSRGGGTSLAGQCCNVAVVLDFSRYMNSVLQVDAAYRIARVQPGVVLDTLRARAEEHALTFAPDPATHSRCTLGGMVGNNSCGVHALMGGKTVDNIDELDILLYDGTRMTVGRTSESELERIIAAGGRKGEIYDGLRSLRDRFAEQIRARFPRIPRRVSGYNLDELLPENGFHVARALVGSEGTCVTVLEARCILTPSPQHRRLVALGFPDAFLAADYVPFVLAHKPIGLEGFDGALVDGMLAKNLAVEDVGLLPAGRGFLLAEFGADSDEAVDLVASAFAADALKLTAAPVVSLYTPADAERVWRVRESALGATVFVPGQGHRWEGWEDSAVPPEHLGAYLRELFALLDQFGYNTPMYGHFGQGCVHLRINFDLESKQGIVHYRHFLDHAAEIVLKYGGSLSGEHGDGQARAALLPKMFGEELMGAFREFKSLWDPTNCMNPGKLIDPVRVNDPAENLRLGAGYQPAHIDTHFSFAEDAGSFAGATLRCVGVGACRKVDTGTMCPSFMA